MAVPHPAPDPAQWAPITIDEIRDAVGSEQLDAGLDRLTAKTASAAERYRAAGHDVADQT